LINTKITQYNYQQSISTFFRSYTSVSSSSTEPSNTCRLS